MTTTARAPIEVYEDGEARIVKVGPMGPYGNNAYIVRDTSAHAGLLIDMPLEEAPLLAAITAEGGVQTIVASHWHLDHWATYDAVRAATGAPVLVGDAEINIPEERIDGRLREGEPGGARPRPEAARSDGRPGRDHHHSGPDRGVRGW